MAGGTPVPAALTDHCVSIMIGALAVAIVAVAIAWLIGDIGIATGLRKMSRWHGADPHTELLSGLSRCRHQIEQRQRNSQMADRETVITTGSDNGGAVAVLAIVVIVLVAAAVLYFTGYIQLPGAAPAGPSITVNVPAAPVVVETPAQ